MPDCHGRHELARRDRYPECGEEYERPAGYWKGSCGPPTLDRRQRTLVAGLLLRDGCVGGNGVNKHVRLSTRWRPFARWVFAKLDWFAATVTRVADARAERVMALLESVGLEPTRAGRRVQLPPKQTTAWLDWSGTEPVPDVAYKWAADREAYRTANRDAEALHARPWERVAGTGGSDGS